MAWPRGESKTGSKSLASMEKERQALQLRLAGATYDQIARTVGYNSPTAAYKAVRRGIKKAMLEAGAEEVLKAALLRLDRLLFAVWKEATADPPNLAALDKVITILDRQLAWQGLKPPKKLELTGAGGQPLQVQTEQIDWSQATVEDLRYLKSLRERLSQRAALPDSTQN